MDILQLLTELKNHYDWNNIKTDISNRYIQAKYLELNKNTEVKEIESDDVYSSYTYTDKKRLSQYETVMQKMDKVLKAFQDKNRVQLKSGNTSELSLTDMALLSTLNKNKPENKSPNKKTKIGRYAVGAGLVGAGLYFSRDIYNSISSTYQSIFLANDSANTIINDVNNTIIHSVNANEQSVNDFTKDYNLVSENIDKESKQQLDKINAQNSNIENSNKKLQEFSKHANNNKEQLLIKDIESGKFASTESSKQISLIEKSMKDEFTKSGVIADIQKSAIKSSFKSSKTFDSYYSKEYNKLYTTNKLKNVKSEKSKSESITVDFTQLIYPASTANMFSEYSSMYSNVDLGGLNQNNINFTVSNLKVMGVNNQYIQTAIVAKMYMETGYKNLVEHSYRTTDNNRLRELFGRLDGISDAQLTAAKNAGDSEFYDLIYGEMYSHNKGLGLGNDKKGDAYRYRGRGFVGITGKNMYRIIGNIIGIDLLTRPELLEDPEIAMKASIAYLTYMTKIKKIDINSARSQEEANSFIFQAIGGKNILESEFGKKEFAKMMSITTTITSQYNMSGGSYTTPGVSGNTVLPNTINATLPSNFIPSVYLGKPGLNYTIENGKVYYIGAGYKLANKNLEYAINSTTQLNGALLLYIYSQFPYVNVSSSWRTQAVLGDGTKTDLHQYGAAIDIDYGAGATAQEDKIARVLNSSGFLPHMTELIYSKDGTIKPNGTDGFINIKRGQYFNYSPSTIAMHHNHIHAGWVPNHDIGGWYNAAKSLKNNPPVIMLSDGSWYTRMSGGITKVANPSNKVMESLMIKADYDREKAKQELRFKEQQQNKTKVELKRNKEFNKDKAKSNFKPA